MLRGTALPPSSVAYEASVPLLRSDPELAGNMPETVRGKLRRGLLAPVASVTPGRWEPPWLPGSDVEGDEDLPVGGLLVLQGLLMREVRLHEQTAGRGHPVAAVELLGPGDLLRPWQDEETELLRCAASWQVFEPVRLALIDRDVLRVGSRWPELTEQLLARCLRRARWLTVATALNSARTSRERLVLCFEHLADRWGRVTPMGIVIPLPLTHRLLAQLTEMTRPTCTTALSWLAKEELVSRRDRGAWLLRSDAYERLAELLDDEGGLGGAVG